MKNQIQKAHYLMAIDIGGTFTDIVLLNRFDGRQTLWKVLSTPSEPSVGAMQGFKQILELADVRPSEIEALIHSTTIVTNAAIEKKGAKTALITTSGFRDILEIGRENRYDIYDLFLEHPEPLVPRSLRKEISERTDKTGKIECEPDEHEILEIIKSLDRENVESLAICFLFSFMNTANEERVANLISENFGSMSYSLSSQVVGEFREYERTATTVMDAYVKPIMKTYIDFLVKDLAKLGFNGKLFIMLSNGGIAPAIEVAHSYPVRAIESGPAAGALMARFQGELLKKGQFANEKISNLIERQMAVESKSCLDAQESGSRDQPKKSEFLYHKNIFSFDMGGTTAKACLIREGIPTISHEFEAARVHRFKKGSGYPLKISTVELSEIGAGGGSVAWIDELGLMKVGPQSSGADPGPCCYDRGGTEPTVTDADLILGYLDTAYFLGGEMPLNCKKSIKAFEDFSAILGMDVVSAAWGVHNMVNENMAAAIKVYSAEKAVDLRKCTMVSFGGAGPVHAYSLARKLHIPIIISPYGAGVASAIGSLVAPPSVDFAKSYITAIGKLDWNRLNDLFDEMEKRGREVLHSAGIADCDMNVCRSADLRYQGQGYEINVPIPDGVLSFDSKEIIERTFWNIYERLYSRNMKKVEIEGVSWRMTVSAPALQIKPPNSDHRKIDSPTKKIGRRKVYFYENNGYTDVDIYDRNDLTPGFEASGPAIVHEKESTVVIGPKCSFFIDEYFNLIQILF